MGMSIFTQAFYCGNCALTVLVANEFVENFHSTKDDFSETNDNGNNTLYASMVLISKYLSYTIKRVCHPYCLCQLAHSCIPLLFR